MELVFERCCPGDSEKPHGYVIAFDATEGAEIGSHIYIPLNSIQSALRELRQGVELTGVPAAYVEAHVRKVESRIEEEVAAIVMGRMAERSAVGVA